MSSVSCGGSRCWRSEKRVEGVSPRVLMNPDALQCTCTAWNVNLMRHIFGLVERLQGLECQKVRSTLVNMREGG